MARARNALPDEDRDFEFDICRKGNSELRDLALMIASFESFRVNSTRWRDVLPKWSSIHSV